VRDAEKRDRTQGPAAADGQISCKNEQG